MNITNTQRPDMAETLAWIDRMADKQDQKDKAAKDRDNAIASGVDANCAWSTYWQAVSA
jgi:hypothetical protein